MTFRSISVVNLTAVLAIVILASAGIANYRSLEVLRQADLWVVRTRDVELALERLLGAMQDAETGERGYLLIGDAAYLAPYTAAVPRVWGQLDQLAAITTDTPAQLERVRALRATVATRLDLAARTVAQREAGMPVSSLTELSREAERQMGRLRGEVAGMEEAERNLLATRRLRAANARAAARASDLVLAVLAIALVGTLVAVARRDAKRIRRGEERLAATFESIGDAVIATDGAGAIERLNPVAERLTGWSLDEVRGRALEAVFQCLREDDGSVLASPIRRVLEAGGPVSFEARTVLVRRDGERLPIEDTVAPIGVPGRDMQGVVVVFRDATENRRIERARAESEERFRRIADGMPQIVWVANEAGVPEYVNRRWAEYTGDALNPAGMHHAAVHVEDRPVLVANWAAARAAEGPFETQYRMRDRDGVWRWFLTRAVPIRDPDTGALRWYGSSTDIDTEVRVREALAEADRRKDEFLATLAHELRNPLAPIRNAAQLLRAPQTADAERSWATGVIDRQVRNMSALLDDLLDVSRITRGTVIIAKQRVSVRSLLTAAVEMARPLIEGRNHELDVAGDLDLMLDADPLRMTQALGNLLNNAAKYSDPGGRISVRVVREESGVSIGVEDRGIGLEPRDLARVFEMFAQVATTRERSDGGLGIGLALVKGLVELHGGHVEAHSDGLGHGAEFRIVLPGPIEAEPAEMGLAEGELASAAAVSELRGLKVLLADDNRDGAAALARMLELAGHEVQVAADGADALAKAEDGRPQVILLDIGMPLISGYEVARQLRARAWTRGVLLIAITGWGQSRDRARSRESGFDHHLVKPVDANELLALIRDSRMAQNK